MNLYNTFETAIKSFGMHTLTHPLFHNSNIAIRFDIGDNEDYDSEYVNTCLEKVTQIYNKLKNKPELLVIDGHIYENDTAEDFINSVISAVNIPLPHEIKCEEICVDEEVFTHIFLCWELKDFNPNNIFKEIIMADLGSGNHFLTSSVYFVCSEDNVLFHLYDDRGADLIADKKETIFHIYKEFNHFISDYYRAKIDNTFRG